ncbi:Equistatin like protein [Argiope bruennichi]|uniref:Equistatin like protein n=1 Tax=Argiope bruennichi TaxID=94029 RepID=A0A8T0EL56_ARGBR|nr:Equistatin like protein [Argiope bruennichi]
MISSNLHSIQHIDSVTNREGDKCDTQVIAPIPRQACGPRLMCDKLEKKCYCVDKNGKRIFGTEIASEVNMTRLERYCNCSREYEEFPKTVPNGDFLRCLPNGDYDRLQCTEEWCYCMESENPDVIEVAKFNTSLKGLSCYDEKIHKDFDATFRSNCWNERNSLKQIIKKHEDQQIAVIGIDLPECDLDGSYAPVQCRQESCFCVDKEGNPFEGYKVPRHSKEGEEMDCRCVRDKFFIRQQKEKNQNMKDFDIYKCAPNGNYKPPEFI